MRKRTDGDATAPKNRYNRDDLMSVLEDLRQDVEDGDVFSRDFDQDLLEHWDLVTGLPELFQSSGLDPTAPGHWQLLLLTISNAIHPDWDGPKVRWAVAKEPFMDRICDLHREHPGDIRERLCERFKEERPSGEHWSTAETLRQKVSEFLGAARRRRDLHQASESELRWLSILGDKE